MTAAYFAGLIDGSCVITVRCTSRGLYVPTIAAHHPLARLLRETFGGVLGLRGPDTWDVVGAQADACLRAVRPHLHAQCEAADNALAVMPLQQALNAQSLGPDTASRDDIAAELVGCYVRSYSLRYGHAFGDLL